MRVPLLVLTIKTYNTNDTVYQIADQNVVFFPRHTFRWHSKSSTREIRSVTNPEIQQNGQIFIRGSQKRLDNRAMVANMVKSEVIDIRTAFWQCCKDVIQEYIAKHGAHCGRRKMYATN